MKNFKMLILLFVFIALTAHQAFAGASFDPVEGRVESVVSLIWDQEMVDDFAGWNLYAKTTGDTEFVKIKTIQYDGVIKEDYSTDVKLWSTPETEESIDFALTAFDLAGNESVKNTPKTIRIDLLPPPVPGAITVTVVVNVTINQ